MCTVCDRASALTNKSNFEHMHEVALKRWVKINTSVGSAYIDKPSVDEVETCCGMWLVDIITDNEELHDGACTGPYLW